MLWRKNKRTWVVEEVVQTIVVTAAIAVIGVLRVSSVVTGSDEPVTVATRT